MSTNECKIVYISPGTLRRESICTASEDVTSVRVENFNKVMAVLFMLSFLNALYNLLFRRGPSSIFH